ncbi:FliI/YscN family ATPase [Cognatiyoonia sp. IB215446]|uniref:FliI/YscN family ATPase n=1 Tax=Cognatiyoonia sp. IB215446 TaxID=3097355 RepID=UPI002A14AF4D|nr:FliI/YscN family ATPase [Cognatiyoonia sp. IB215446]MDX8346423.1 FliI/YscN family ATPase [Cognatiyoonia sp. IB215446]
MTENIIDQMQMALAGLDPVYDVGRVQGVSGGTVQVGGVIDTARVGDRVEIRSAQRTLSGEVVKLDSAGVHLLMEAETDGISIGDAAIFQTPTVFAPDASWIGRVVDPDGRPMDGKPLLPGPIPRRRRNTPPSAHMRRGLGPRLETGLAVFNTMLPIVQGQRIGLFAGSGVGKSTLLADLARGVAADVIVIALVGERGRELRHFVEEVLGVDGMTRAVVVAATSDQSPQKRRQCAWAAMAVAEHFRDAGQQVLLLVDSVTRFCEAHREIALAAGESANLRGYPASTGPTIAALCERAGPGLPSYGDITAIFSVLVAGSDMDEPVADMLRGVLDGHVVLDREIAERGHFPAINVLKSVSRALPYAATPQENTLIAQARAHLGCYDRAELMIQSGLYAAGSDKAIDAAIHCVPALHELMTVKDQRGSLSHFAKLRQAMQGANNRFAAEEVTGSGP